MTTFQPQQFGKYFLLEKLAVGGMAEIYKAKTFGAEGFEKLLAIKRILPHAAEDKDFINMLIDEAKLSVLLSHANIVQVYDLGKAGNDYFISMEYIHGVNLRDVLYRLREKNQKMSAELSIYVASEVCKGLDYAHRKAGSNNQPLGIVHRDISPQNILISFDGEVKIVDFGIAKAAMNISHTMAGILKGKIAYMSPEQAMGKTIDSRTDIFSLGILLYEALTGKKLYTGESQFEVLKKIRTTRIDVKKLPESIPPHLKTILSKALAYLPEERYESASDMQIALTKYLYATFTDFSPRKLAHFVQELFQEELLKDKKGIVEQEKISEAKTSSLNIEEGGQENIVHRETSSGMAKAVFDRSFRRAITLSGLSKFLTSKKAKKKAMVLGSIFLLLSAVGTGLLIKKIFLPSQKPLTEAKGTLQVLSEPSGAKIILNGEKTSYTTPAVIENLELESPYTVSLELAQHGRQEKSITLTESDPLTITMTLSKSVGVLNIISDPPGAAILVNGVATGKVTPSTLEDLALGTEYRLTISKPDFHDYEQPITLLNTTPQKVTAILKPVVLEIKQTSLLINTTPSAAKILLDGKETGLITPAKIENIEIGKAFTIRLEKEGYEPIVKEMILTDENPKTISETLVEKAKTSPTQPTPPPPTAVQDIIGSLRVNSDPSGATILLDGKNTGKVTPATLDSLKKGTYTIRLLKKDFQPFTRKMTINSVEPYSIDASLEKSLPPSPPPPEEKTPAKGQGSIQVNSDPSGADIFIQGRHYGTTPRTLSVSAGTVTVLVSREGEHPCSQTVQVTPGRTSMVDCSLGSLYGKITVTSFPPRADVIFNGQNVGKTPLTIKKVNRNQDHSIRLVLNGYQPWAQSFDLRNSASKNFNVDLQEE